ncbi:hypothetical protein D5S17_06830 [Pseudonocardiaceae bacterium YIM PH 21723]|nr:hypothetical protein D5S17_06830 [Pseudonocardiaceae bacterium YIM PH 21723]
MLLLMVLPLPLAARLRGPRIPRLLAFPPVTTAVFVAPLFLIYLTPLYGLTVRSTVAASLVHLALPVCGFVYYRARLQGSPLVSFAVSLAEVVFDGVLGLILWLGPLIAATRSDQVIGAGILWIGGDLAGIPFVLTLLRRWERSDREQAATSDAEPAPDGLWWESDPVLAERFGREG